MSDSNLVIEIVQGDVLDYTADVLALKYAQHYYGSDQAVCEMFLEKGVAAENELKPSIGKHVWVDSSKNLRYQSVLLVGVPPLLEFGYLEIENWARLALTLVTEHHPGGVHVAITLHGPGFGLDEIEALRAEVRGIINAARQAAGVSHVIRVSIVERNAARVQLLQMEMSKIIADLDKSGAELTDKTVPASAEFDVALQRDIVVRCPLKLNLRRPEKALGARSEAEMAVESAGLQSAAQVENKPRAFVAMPFSQEMEDVFYYGIQNPVRQLGYICERVDQEVFIGDILEQVKMRIEKAEIVIADLTGANPNVYLEVGFAWGKGRPTLLIANKKDDLKFDVRGQRCLKYQSIKDLEKQLTTELKGLGLDRLP